MCVCMCAAIVYRIHFNLLNSLFFLHFSLTQKHNEMIYSCSLVLVVQYSSLNFVIVLFFSFENSRLCSGDMSCCCCCFSVWFFTSFLRIIHYGLLLCICSGNAGICRILFERKCHIVSLIIIQFFGWQCD